VDEPSGRPPALSRAGIERGFLANSQLIIASRIATAGLSLITVPVLVAHFGVDGYGSWEALLALASLSSMAQTAIAGTLVWRASTAYAIGDAEELRRTARVGAGLTWLLCLMVVPLAWLLRHAAVEFLGLAPDLQPTASLMFPVVAALLLLNGFCETLEAIISGCLRTGLVNVIGAVAHCVNYSVVIGATMSGAGMWGLVAGLAAAFVTRLAGGWIASRAVFGPLSLAPILPGRRDLSALRYSGVLTISALAGSLRDQTDKVVFASLASPTWVGYYGMAARLASLVMEILRPLYLPLITATAALNSLGDWAGVRRLYARSMAIVSLLTGAVVVVVAGLSDRLVTIWVGRPVPEVTPLVWLLIGGSAAAAILTGPGTAVSRGSGRPGLEASYLGANLLLNLVATIVLILLMGPIGTAAATGLTWAASSVFFILLLHRQMDLPGPASWRGAGAAALALVGAIAMYTVSSALTVAESRADAVWSMMWLGPMAVVAYLAAAVVTRLISPRDVVAGFRMLVRRSA
jgi:O-antigen/teichoic acid export membrane protein